MALKADIVDNVTSVMYLSNMAVEAGQCVFLKPTQSSGYASGQGINENAPEVVVTGTPSSGAAFVGLALSDMVAVDLTVPYYSRPLGTIQVTGDRLAILKDGEVWTNRVNGTPIPGSGAYPGTGSNLGTTGINSVPAAGTFLTSKTADGYCKVSVKVA